MRGRKATAKVRARFKGENIVCAYARPAAGPGWDDRPLWVILRDGNGKLREECLQPEEQGDTILTLYDIAARVDEQLTAAVRWWLR